MPIRIAAAMEIKEEEDSGGGPATTNRLRDRWWRIRNNTDRKAETIEIKMDR